jgi:murein DD-endopeptidase MepM/ murein hydrolase activator NlpD
MNSELKIKNRITLLQSRKAVITESAVYGNYVIITHHSGYKSLYAHMSQITCKRGNFVYTNTMIGRVGSTGQSTGPHLHWTVYKNGKTVNPLSLIN